MSSLLLIEPNRRVASLAAQSCARRNHPVRVAIKAEQAVRFFKHQPAKLIICEIRLAQRCMAAIRALPGGEEAQVLLTVSGDRKHPLVRKFAESVGAERVLPWPLPVLDLIDAIEQHKSADVAPSAVCLRNLTTLARLWSERSSGQLHVVDQPGVGLVLRRGEMVSVRGGSLESILSRGALRFVPGSAQGGTAWEGTLAEELWSLAVRGARGMGTAWLAGQKLTPDERVLLLPLSLPTRRLLLDSDGQAPVSALLGDDRESASRAMSELAAVSVLGLLPVARKKGLPTYSRVRGFVESTLAAVEQGKRLAALGLPEGASEERQARAATNLRQQLSVWARDPELPADVQDSLRRLQKHFALRGGGRNQTARIQKLLQEARGHLELWDWSAAEASVDAILALDGEHAQALALAGWTRFKQSDLRGALALLEQACVVNPRDAAAHFYRAQVLSAAGRGDDALAAAERACALRPHEPPYASLLSELRG